MTTCSYMSVEALLGDYSTALSCFCNLLLVPKTKQPEGETGTLPTLPMFIFVFSQFMLFTLGNVKQFPRHFEIFGSFECSCHLHI